MNKNKGGLYMRAKTIVAMSESGLDKKLNAFFKNNQYEIIDIKLSSTLLYMSALILLKDN